MALFCNKHDSVLMSLQKLCNSFIAVVHIVLNPVRNNRVNRLT